MRIYPDLPGQQLRAVAGDAIVLTILLVCLAIGQAVHDTVSELDVLGRGVQQAGTSVREGFEDAGDRVDGAPVVGDDLRRALRNAGERTSEPVVEAGGRGREAVSDLADLLGWTAGGLPALVVLLWWLPGRIRRMRGLLAARRVLASGPAVDERQRVVAMRAAFDLPFSTLLAHTRDPFGDLAAGRYDPLLAALGAEYGIRVPGATGPSATPNAAP